MKLITELETSLSAYELLRFEQLAQQEGKSPSQKAAELFRSALADLPHPAHPAIEAVKAAGLAHPGGAR